MLMGEGQVHVWRADLDGVNDDVLGSLCQEERARAERFPNKHDGRLWQRAHGVLRALLGRYLDRDPGTLRFTTGAQGKPELEQNPARGSQLSFNLSHSGTLALFAFAFGEAVGVDVEVARRPLEEVAIAERLFGPGEAKRLQGLEQGEREREFLRAWVRKEAELKCRGSGLAADTADAREAPVWIAELDVGPGAAAAVACERSPLALRYLEWTAGAGGASP